MSSSPLTPRTSSLLIEEGMVEVAPCLKAAGLRSISEIYENSVTETDLEEIGVTKLFHRKKLIRLSRGTIVNLGSSDDVSSGLNSRRTSMGWSEAGVGAAASSGVGVSPTALHHHHHSHPMATAPPSFHSPPSLVSSQLSTPVLSPTPHQQKRDDIEHSGGSSDHISCHVIAARGIPGLKKVTLTEREYYVKISLCDIIDQTVVSLGDTSAKTRYARGPFPFFLNEKDSLVKADPVRILTDFTSHCVALELRERHMLCANKSLGVCVLPISFFHHFKDDTVMDNWFPVRMYDDPSSPISNNNNSSSSMDYCRMDSLGSCGRNSPNGWGGCESRQSIVIAHLRLRLTVPGGCPSHLGRAFHVTGVNMSQRKLRVTVFGAILEKEEEEKEEGTWHKDDDSDRLLMMPPSSRKEHQSHPKNEKEKLDQPCVVNNSDLCLLDVKKGGEGDDAPSGITDTDNNGVKTNKRNSICAPSCYVSLSVEEGAKKKAARSSLQSTSSLHNQHTNNHHHFSSIKNEGGGEDGENHEPHSSSSLGAVKCVSSSDDDDDSEQEENDEGGDVTLLAQTHTVYNSLSPCFDETFEFFAEVAKAKLMTCKLREEVFLLDEEEEYDDENDYYKTRNKKKQHRRRRRRTIGVCRVPLQFYLSQNEASDIDNVFQLYDPKDNRTQRGKVHLRLEVRGRAMKERSANYHRTSSSLGKNNNNGHNNNNSRSSSQSASPLSGSLHRLSSSQQKLHLMGSNPLLDELMMSTTSGTAAATGAFSRGSSAQASPICASLAAHTTGKGQRGGGGAAVVPTTATTDHDDGNLSFDLMAAVGSGLGKKSMAMGGSSLSNSTSPPIVPSRVAAVLDDLDIDGI